MKDITLLMDMSASMLREAYFPAMVEAYQDIKSIIFSSDADAESEINNYRVIQCLNNTIAIMEDREWIPDEKSCGGVASVNDAFRIIVNDTDAANSNILICLSDGMLCASPTTVKRFYDWYVDIGGVIIEVNVTSNKKGLFKSSGGSILETVDTNFRDQIKQLLRN